jgi:hypothetical protein
MELSTLRQGFEWLCAIVLVPIAVLAVILALVGFVLLFPFRIGKRDDYEL